MFEGKASESEGGVCSKSSLFWWRSAEILESGLTLSWSIHGREKQNVNPRRGT